MLRILSSATAGWLILATTTVAAQQPTGTGKVPPPKPAVMARAMPRIEQPRILPGTSASVFSAIQGSALTSTNGILPNANVRLRNARIGQIVESQVTDRSGIFSFRSVDPGSYIVEVLGSDRNTVLAASQLLYVGPGEAISALVKLPFKTAPLGGVLGQSVSSATLITSQAAASGVLAAQVAGAPTCEVAQ
jgi:hypothetical protein